MNYIRSLKLDFNAESAVHPIVNVKQNDRNTRFLKIGLYSDGTAYAPESGVPILFRCKNQESGSTVTLSTESTDPDYGSVPITKLNENTIQVVLTESVTREAGLCLCDICLDKGSEILSTEAFYIRVHPSPGG